jgi:SagB-type dehydrogenase family enzyme
MRLRRARCLMCYWHEGSFVVHRFPGGTPLALHPAAAELLSAFEDWTDPATAAAQLDHLTADTVTTSVAALAEAGLLLAEHTPEADRDDRLAVRWRTWAPEASFFHYATADPDRYTSPQHPTGDQPTADPVDDDAAEHALFTGYPDAPRLLLPRRPADLRAPFDQVLYARRTCRDWTDQPVPLATLAGLLATVFGPVDYIDSGSSALLRRTSPAGGSRQELDAYLGVLNVDGVEPGFYHYNIRDHALELRSAGLTPADSVALCANQDWAGGAAFLVVLAAVLDRMTSKYHDARCYGVSLLNAGHLGQTFALTATALGLGPAQTGAFCDTPLAERCRLDNIGTIPLYVLAAGWPHPQPRHAPPPARLDTFANTTLI